MKKLALALERAQTSGFQKWMLNRMMWAVIPFNSPHRLKVDLVTEDEIRVLIPFRKKNLNHLKSLHACAMATAAEYASGLALLRKADASKYRLIMQKLEVEYHYQGRTSAYSKAVLSAEVVEREILKPLEAGQESVMYEARAEVYDSDERLLCTATVHWQIKAWDKVRKRS